LEKGIGALSKSIKSQMISITTSIIILLNHELTPHVKQTIVGRTAVKNFKNTNKYYPELLIPSLYLINPQIIPTSILHHFDNLLHHIGMFAWVDTGMADIFVWMWFDGDGLFCMVLRDVLEYLMGSEGISVLVVAVKPYSLNKS
jgi:hypothetical protein